MSATVLTITNRVLRRLRKSTVSSVSGNSYAELIVDLMTEAKEEVEDAFDWQTLQGTVLMDTVASTYRYKLQGVYERSLIKKVYDQTNDWYLTHDPAEVDKGLRIASPATGAPKYYDFVGYNDGEMLVDLYPVPDVDDIRIFWHGKMVQGDLSYTDPDTTYIVTPTLPMVLGTLYRAIEERGEDDGEALTKLERKFLKALAHSVTLDNAAQGDIMDWEADFQPPQGR